MVMGSRTTTVFVSFLNYKMGIIVVLLPFTCNLKLRFNSVNECKVIRVASSS